MDEQIKMYVAHNGTINHEPISFPVNASCHHSFIIINISRDIVSKIIIDSAKDGEHTINGSLIQHLFDHSPTSVIEEHKEFEYTKEVIRIRKSTKDTQHNGQK
jgi:hypothetical protein